MAAPLLARLQVRISNWSHTINKRSLLLLLRLGLGPQPTGDLGGLLDHFREAGEAGEQPQPRAGESSPPEPPEPAQLALLR